MLNVNASATMTILSKFFCKEDSYDQLVSLFYAIFNDKEALAGKKNEIAKETNSKNFLLQSKESEKYTNKGFLILTQKKIKIYYADLIQPFLVTPIINVVDILQDLENENYIEIIYLNDKNARDKIEITIENKHYFIEKFLENYVYEKTFLTNNLIFFNLSEKINFREKIESGKCDPVISYFLNFKFENKFNEYHNYIQKLKFNADPASDDSVNSDDNDENSSDRPGNKPIDIGKSNGGIVNKNTVSQRDYYARKIFRFKKNWFLIPSVFSKKSNDVLYIPNPENKKFPIKLIMGSSKTFPVELLDYDSDIADIKEVAFEKLFRTIENITGKVDFYLTKSKKYIKQNNIGCPQDLGKTVTWILEAKTKIKKNSFHNIIMVFIRKSFYPPFFDTCKDYYFFVMEKINLPNKPNFKKNILQEDNVIDNNLVCAVRPNKNLNQEKIRVFDERGELVVDCNPKDSKRDSNSDKVKKNTSFNNNNFRNNSNFSVDKLGLLKLKGDKNADENELAGKRSKSNQCSLADNKIENISVETYEKDGKIYKRTTRKILVKKNKQVSQEENSDTNFHINDANIKSLNNDVIQNNYNLSMNNLDIQNPNKTFTDGEKTGRKTKIISVKKTSKIQKGNLTESQSREKSLRNSINSNNTNLNNNVDTKSNKSNLIESNKSNVENENQPLNLVEKQTKSMRKSSPETVWTGEISKLARSIVTDIAETFNSMLTFHKNFIEKMKTLSLIRLETFSCFKSFYENVFHDFTETVKFNNIQTLKKIGIDLLYKILLILKESSYDQISDDLNLVENIIKMANENDENYWLVHREHIKKNDFSKILEQNDEFLDSIFYGYYLKTDEDSKNLLKPKEKNKSKKKGEVLDNLVFENFSANQTNKNGVTATRKFLTDNRNDFVVYCLSGKLVDNLTIDLKKILKFSLRKETIKSMIKSIVFPLLNLRSMLDIDTKSDKDLINEICESKDNTRLHITFNEDVLCAMIESDFFRKAEIINLTSSYERFLIYILEKHGSNRTLVSVFRFLKEEKRNSVNYDFMVQKNFNKNSYLENFYKKIELEDKNLNNPNKSEFDKSFLSRTQFINDEKLTPEVKTKGAFGATNNPETYSPDMNKTAKNTNDVKNLKNSIAEIKMKFEKELSFSLNNNLDELLKEKNDTINQLSQNFCFVLFKFYSSYNSNLCKILTSCKCLILLSKWNSRNRKLLIERGIFEVIFSYLFKFNEEKTLTASLKLMNSLLDQNDISVINYLKSHDKWDDYLGNIISVILNFKYQSIKCSTKLVAVLIEIFISISNFNFDMTKLFTVGYENNEKYIYNLEELEMTMMNSIDNKANKKRNSTNVNNQRYKNKKDGEKKSKLLIFIERLLDESYINQAFKDPENSHTIYERILIFLCKIYKNYENAEWMRNLIRVIDRKLSLVLRSFIDYYNKTKSTSNFNQGTDDLDNSDEAKNFIYYCKIYFITLNFYETIYDLDDWDEINRPNSYAGMVLQFLNAVQLHKDFNYIWEKSKSYIEFLEDPIGDKFEHFAEELRNMNG